MENITRPRSFAKTAAIAAITLLAAGCVTALGIGLEGMLWQMKNATAEVNKAHALMEQAKAQMEQANAQMEQAKSTVSAAAEQATGIIEAAKYTAKATIDSAALNAKATVDAATQANLHNIQSASAANTAFYEPSKQYTVLTGQKARLEDEVATGLDYETQKPLTAQQLTAKETEIQVVQRKIGVVQKAVQQNITGGITTFVDGIITAYRKYAAPPKPSTPATTAPIQ